MLAAFLNIASFCFRCLPLAAPFYTLLCCFSWARNRGQRWGKLELCLKLGQIVLRWGFRRYSCKWRLWDFIATAWGLWGALLCCNRRVLQYQRIWHFLFMEWCKAVTILPRGEKENESRVRMTYPEGQWEGSEIERGHRMGRWMGLWECPDDWQALLGFICRASYSLPVHSLGLLDILSCDSPLPPPLEKADTGELAVARLN